MLVRSTRRPRWKELYEQIDEGIRVYDRLLLILSSDSMNSQWVKTEIAHARQKELDENRHVLFPISIVPFETIKTWKDFDADIGKDSARDIREHYIPDFSDWKEAPEAVGIWENELTGCPHSEQKRFPRKFL